MSKSLRTAFRPPPANVMNFNKYSFSFDGGTFVRLALNIISRLTMVVSFINISIPSIVEELNKNYLFAEIEKVIGLKLSSCASVFGGC